MFESTHAHDADDPYDLSRFLRAQEDDYEVALSEIRRGKKRSHWLFECAEATICVVGRSAAAIFGSPDDLKLRSCATLFACVLPSGSVFDRVLGKYYEGRPDGKTLELLGIDPTRPFRHI